MKINVSEQKQKLQTWWKDKAKPWLSKNGEKVIAGTGVALGVGAVVAAVVSGRKSSNYTIPDNWDDIEPLVIDINKDDWKDQLTTLGRFNDKPLTVRQEEAVSALETYFHNRVMGDGLISTDVAASIADDFCKFDPGSAEVLNKMPGFWVYSES